MPKQDRNPVNNTVLEEAPPLFDEGSHGQDQAGNLSGGEYGFEHEEYSRSYPDDSPVAANEFFEGTTEQSIQFGDETILWEGGPSQIVNIPKFLGCIATFLFSAYCLIEWHNELYIGYEELTPFINTTCQTMMAIPLVLMFFYYLDIRYEHTIITHNKIKEQKGITRIFRREKYCELSDIRDVESPAPGILLGVFGLSSVVIETNDDDQLYITIRAISDRDRLIENLLPLWRKIKLERKGFFSDR